MLYHIDDPDKFTGLSDERIEMMKQEYGVEAENIVRAVTWAVGEPNHDFAAMLPNIPYSNEQIYRFLCALNASLERSYIDEADLPQGRRSELRGHRRARQEGHPKSTLHHSLTGLHVVQLHDPQGCHVRVAQDVPRLLMRARGRVGQDEALGGELADRRFTSRREVVIGCGNEDELVIEQTDLL